MKNQIVHFELSLQRISRVELATLATLSLQLYDLGENSLMYVYIDEFVLEKGKSFHCFRKDDQHGTQYRHTTRLN